MVNKRGWIRLVESTLAILIILAFLIINPYKKDSAVSSDPSYLVTPVLDQIAQNSTLRYKITNNQIITSSDINLTIEKMLAGSNLKFEAKLCSPTGNCDAYMTPRNKEIYSYERIISTTPYNSDFNPKKLKLFVWRN